jgi:hypothetical protein
MDGQLTARYPVICVLTNFRGIVTSGDDTP